MKKIITLFLILFLISCSKEEIDYSIISGKWVSPDPFGRNVINFGYFDDTVKSSRRISYNADTLSIVISDAPAISVRGEFSNNTLYYSDYITQNHPITPNCAIIKISYFNITSKIVNDTLMESGKYIVFVNDVEQINYNSSNKYLARFVKK